MLEPLQTGRVCNVHPINKTDTANKNVNTEFRNVQLEKNTRII